MLLSLICKHMVKYGKINTDMVYYGSAWKLTANHDDICHTMATHGRSRLVMAKKYKKIPQSMRNLSKIWYNTHLTILHAGAIG